MSISTTEWPWRVAKVVPFLLASIITVVLVAKSEARRPTIGGWIVTVLPRVFREAWKASFPPDLEIWVFAGVDSGLPGILRFPAFSWSSATLAMQARLDCVPRPNIAIV